MKSNMCIASSFNYTSLSISTKYISKTQRAKKMAYVPKNTTLTSSKWKGKSLFSSLSREMLTFSRLNVHN